MIYKLGEVASRVGARLVGDPETEIHGVGTLTGAGGGQITFLTNSRYRRYLRETGASAVILAEADVEYCPAAALVADNPHLTYARVAGLFAPAPDAAAGVHPSAVVDPSAEIAPGASIGPQAVVGAGAVVEAGAIVGPNCVVGRKVRIGRDSRLVAGVTIYDDCILGQRVLVHGGAVIGADGFGFAYDAGSWVKVPQLGRVRIGDDVEIGAGTTIDRGAIEDTVIEDGVKLDNLIQIAHNVRVGSHTAMAGCVGVAGSTTIGAHCAVGGGAGILGHLTIPDGTTITATSLVTKSIKSPGSYSSGTPLEPSERWQRNFARFKQLDDMARRLKALEKELEDLKNLNQG